MYIIGVAWSNLFGHGLQSAFAGAFLFVIAGSDSEPVIHLPLVFLLWCPAAWGLLKKLLCLRDGD